MQRSTVVATLKLLVVSLLLGVLAAPAAADVLRLRRLLTDAEGNFTVLFSILDSNRDPVVDLDQVPISGIKLYAGDNPAELRSLELDDPTLTTLSQYQAPFRIFIMIPNQDLFNGAEGDANRPDAAGLRSAVQQALQAIPQERTDIKIHVALYNNEVRWMPEYNATQVAELSSALLRNEYVAPAGTRVEDPFNAIDNAYRTRLRRQAREPGESDFVYYFIVVTSALTETAASETFSSELERLRGLLSADETADVVTMVIVYNPVYGPELLFDPGAEPMRFAQGVTPQSGTWRIVGTVADIRNALRQAFDEAVSAFLLRFNNTQLEPNVNYHFKMEATPRGGEELESNLIRGYVREVPVNIWKWIIIAGAILIGLVLIAIVVVFIIKRPKPAPPEPEPVVVEAVKLCVQCGRQLRKELQYCHHCAAEPNYGLLKVIEGPQAGWTFFLRDTVTEVGKAVGNSIIIEGDAGISSSHMKIAVQEGNRYLIEDMGSTNGTYIDNALVKKQFLRNGDVIAIGTQTKMKFTIS